jgi:hypothetical protein
MPTPFKSHPDRENAAAFRTFRRTLKERRLPAFVAAGVSPPRRLPVVARAAAEAARSDGSGRLAAGAGRLPPRREGHAVARPGTARPSSANV